MMKTPTTYRPLQIALHWGIALLILALFVFEDEMGRALRTALNGGTVSYSLGLGFHVFGGLTVLALVIWRLVLRRVVGVPPVPQNDPPMQKLAAHAVHLVLYAVMVLLPMAGAAAWFGGVAAAGEAHEVLGTVLQVVIAAHVLAALWHQFWLKDGLINRMWWRK
jgi:cytochrome b561